MQNALQQTFLLQTIYSVACEFDVCVAPPQDAGMLPVCHRRRIVDMSVPLWTALDVTYSWQPDNNRQQQWEQWLMQGQISPTKTSSTN